ncbi:MCE family protein [Mycobacterium camsae]|uniref:MCE family protein n=1 Tax=Mycobacterium gordonae TaxID=1778 RepID=UPI001981EEA4|nr:MCE family protein [Mycobacterium gordonae]
MRTMSERNPILVGVVGCLITATVVLGALNYNSLPFVGSTSTCSAYFADAAGLQANAPVEVSGLRTGRVTGIELDGARVLVKFSLDKKVSLGDRTQAAIKTKTVLGAKFLEVTPRGEGRQSGPIPLERTTSPYQLTDVLGDLSATISGLDTTTVSDSLRTLAQTFSQTPPALKAAIQGVGRFADTLNLRDQQLRSLLANASKASRVLSDRSDQVVSLIGSTNALLLQLRTQSAALEQISGNISAVARQIEGFVSDNRQTMKTALDKLNGVLTIVDNRKARIQDSIRRLNGYAMSLGESIASGPFFKGYLSNLALGQFVQPFIDAAFSDLGLDPNVLLPSQLSDPQVGQPGTPPLPVPYPRTGQGGEPRLNLPDAITGNPDDPRYPYRPPPPAPPPGGPPPGPPAEVQPPPPQPPVLLPAPGEPSSADSGGRR